MKVLSFLFSGSLKQVILSGIISMLAASFYILAIQAFGEVLQYEQGDFPLAFLKMVGLVLGSTLTAILGSHYITNHFEFKISGTRIKLSELVLKSSFDRIEKKKNIIIPTLYNDIITLGTFAKSLPDFIVSFFTVITIWGYMFFISWEFTLIFIGVFMVAMLIVLVSQSYLYQQEKRAVGERNILYRRMNGLVDGLKELTLNLAHKKVYAKELIGTASDKFAKYNVNRNKVLIAVSKVSESFILISLGVIIIIAAYFETGSELLYDFFTLIPFTLPSLIRIGLFFSNLKKAEVALEQVESLDVLLHEFKDDKIKKGNENTQFNISGDNGPIISLRDVHYEYLRKGGESAFEVGPYNLDINQGEALLINGGNGSGKTTLIKLLTGLYIPSRGEIECMGTKIDYSNLAVYRDIFSAVFADSYVFQDLRYIQHERVDELKERYLDVLEIRNKVSLDDGIQLSTTDLSMGQMSRLNLFRSMLEDKDLYVFDEWAANQDPYFKGKFYNEIIPQLKKEGKTLIIISHAEHYFHVADRRVTVSQGSLLSSN